MTGAWVLRVVVRVLGAPALLRGASTDLWVGHCRRPAPDAQRLRLSLARHALQPRAAGSSCPAPAPTAPAPPPPRELLPLSLSGIPT